MAYHTYEEGYEDGLDAGVAGKTEEVWAAINQIRVGKHVDAIVTLERAFLPTWQEGAACEARYREVMGRA